MNTTTLPVAAADFHVGDEFDEILDGETTRYRVHGAPQPSTRAGQVRVGCSYSVEGGRRHRSLAFPADEQIVVERPLPPTDAEHEANLRALLSDRDPGSVTNGAAIAAVLRLLDQARAALPAQAAAGDNLTQPVSLGDVLAGPVRPDMTVRVPAVTQKSDESRGEPIHGGGHGRLVAPGPCPKCHGYACPAGGCLNGEVAS